VGDPPAEAKTKKRAKSPPPRGRTRVKKLELARKIKREEDKLKTRREKAQAHVGRAKTPPRKTRRHRRLLEEQMRDEQERHFKLTNNIPLRENFKLNDPIKPGEKKITGNIYTEPNERGINFPSGRCHEFDDDEHNWGWLTDKIYGPPGLNASGNLDAQAKTPPNYNDKDLLGVHSIASKCDCINPSGLLSEVIKFRKLSLVEDNINGPPPDPRNTVSLYRARQGNDRGSPGELLHDRIAYCNSQYFNKLDAGEHAEPSPLILNDFGRLIQRPAAWDVKYMPNLFKLFGSIAALNLKRVTEGKPPCGILYFIDKETKERMEGITNFTTGNGSRFIELLKDMSDPTGVSLKEPNYYQDHFRYKGDPGIRGKNFFTDNLHHSLHADTEIWIYSWVLVIAPILKKLSVALIEEHDGSPANMFEAFISACSIVSGHSYFSGQSHWRRIHDRPAYDYHKYLNTEFNIQKPLIGDRIHYIHPGILNNVNSHYWDYPIMEMYTYDLGTYFNNSINKVALGQTIRFFGLIRSRIGNHYISPKVMHFRDAQASIPTVQSQDLMESWIADYRLTAWVCGKDDYSSGQRHRGMKGQLAGICSFKHNLAEIGDKKSIFSRRRWAATYGHIFCLKRKGSDPTFTPCPVYNQNATYNHGYFNFHYGSDEYGGSYFFVNDFGMTPTMFDIAIMQHLVVFEKESKSKAFGNMRNITMNVQREKTRLEKIFKIDYLRELHNQTMFHIQEFTDGTSPSRFFNGSDASRRFYLLAEDIFNVDTIIKLDRSKITLASFLQFLGENSVDVNNLNGVEDIVFFQYHNEINQAFTFFSKNFGPRGSHAYRPFVGIIRQYMEMLTRANERITQVFDWNFPGPGDEQITLTWTDNRGTQQNGLPHEIQLRMLTTLKSIIQTEILMSITQFVMRQLSVLDIFVARKQSQLSWKDFYVEADLRAPTLIDPHQGKARRGLIVSSQAGTERGNISTFGLKENIAYLFQNVFANESYGAGHYGDPTIRKRLFLASDSSIVPFFTELKKRKYNNPRLKDEQIFQVLEHWMSSLLLKGVHDTSKLQRYFVKKLTKYGELNTRSPLNYSSKIMTWELLPGLTLFPSHNFQILEDQPTMGYTTRTPDRRRTTRKKTLETRGGKSRKNKRKKRKRKKKRKTKKKKGGNNKAAKRFIEFITSSIK
tara:strand:+ start:523 stop:4029 length:3507 start_codon:yes stop_codon:yes gene_type:complete